MLKLSASLSGCLLFLCLMQPLLSLASVRAIVVNDGFRFQNVTEEIEFYVDQSDNLSIDQIEQLPETSWGTSNSLAFSFGYSNTRYWFKMTVDNNSNSPLLLHADNPLFDDLTLYRKTGDSFIVERSGMVIAPIHRPIEHREHLFELPANAESKIWIMAKTQGPFFISFKLWNEVAFFTKDSKRMLFYGSYFGALTTLIVLLLIAFVVFKQNALLSLAGLTLSFGIYQLTLIGVFANELWLFEGAYRTAIIFSIGCAIISVYFLFSQTLNLLNESYGGELVLRASAIGALVVMLCMGVIGFEIARYLIATLVVVTSLAAISLSIWLSFHGNRFAIYAAVGSTLILLTSLQQALSRLQLLPVNFTVENITFYGFLSMILVLAVGISFEIRARSNEEISNQQQQERDAQNRQQERQLELEIEVSRRTTELQSALSELSDAHETLKLLNTVDPVTGIKNRYYFDTSFEQEWKRASREGFPISLLMVDIDYFKKVNDTYGHPVGDTCLQLVAARMAAVLKRPADILARYGGEEFVILLPYIENHNAAVLAEEVRRNVEASPFHADDNEIDIQLSIGLATTRPVSAAQSVDLLNAADRALYTAKRSGRNQVYNVGQLDLGLTDQGKSAS